MLPLEDRNLVSSTAHGRVAEYMAIAELLSRGHAVAVPVADDDGVDLVVNYRITAQVKNASRTVLAVKDYDYPGFCWSNNRGKFLADVFILHGLDGGRSRWWIVPVSVFQNFGTKNTINLRKGTRGLGKALSELEDAWHIFGEPLRSSIAA